MEKKMNKNEYKKNKIWYSEAESLLLNKKIVAIAWQKWDNEDVDSATGLVFTTDDDTTFFISCDDEGNEPGALHWVNDKRKNRWGILPTDVADVNDLIKYESENKNG
jgi:hypothetical protein